MTPNPLTAPCFFTPDLVLTTYNYEIESSYLFESAFNQVVFFFRPLEGTARTQTWSTWSERHLVPAAFLHVLRCCKYKRKKQRYERAVSCMCLSLSTWLAFIESARRESIGDSTGEGQTVKGRQPVGGGSTYREIISTQSTQQHKVFEIPSHRARKHFYNSFYHFWVQIWLQKVTIKSSLRQSASISNISHQWHKSVCVHKSAYHLQKDSPVTDCPATGNG